MSIENPIDPFEQRREKIYARIAVMRKLLGESIDEDTRVILDEMHDNVESAKPNPVGKNIFSEAETTLEELEDTMDGF